MKEFKQVRDCTIFLLAALFILDVAIPGPDPAGFVQGWVHGAIGPVTFVSGLFTDIVHFYEVNNTGKWHDLGFGLGFIFAIKLIEVSYSEYRASLKRESE